MKNIEIKKAISERTKWIVNYKIDIEIWQDQDKDKEYYCQVTVFNLDNNENYNIFFGENTLKDICIKEAKKIKNYLSKHFLNVNITEINI